ncbi:hypothetical protein NFI96_033531 [Prochilodus magdalenae]|nr:hypothetical protein NFI96_033531 [Prochilodus magdalenae]
MRVLCGLWFNLRRLSDVSSVGSSRHHLSSYAMRLVQFCRKGDEGGIRVGVEQEQGHGVVDLKAFDSSMPATMRQFLELGQKGMDCAQRALSSGQCVVPRSDIRLLSPVTSPDKVVCVGMNYKDHCLEQNAPIPTEPIIFSKFPSAITGPYDDVMLPDESQEVDWEVELAFVIGQKGRHIKASVAAAFTVRHVSDSTSLSPKTAPDCHGVTQNGSGSSSVTSPALVFVETTGKSMCGGTVVSTKMNSCCRMYRRPGVPPPPPLPHHLQELFEDIQAAWDGLSQDTIRNLYNSMLALANMAARPHTETLLLLMSRSQEEDALSHIAGFTVANDVSARDWQMKRNGKQWLLGKTFDTFCPLGPALVTTAGLKDVHNLGIRCLVNGGVVQDSNTNQLIFKTEKLVAWVSQFVTLYPGDVFLTGTPPGVGVFRKPPVFLKKGDVVECQIDEIGSIKNTVV